MKQYLPFRTTVISNWRPRNTVLDSVWTIGNDAVLAVILNLNDFDPQMTKNGFATYFSNRPLAYQDVRKLEKTAHRNACDNILAVV